MKKEKAHWCMIGGLREPENGCNVFKHGKLTFMGICKECGNYEPNAKRRSNENRENSQGRV